MYYIILYIYNDELTNLYSDSDQKSAKRPFISYNKKINYCAKDKLHRHYSGEKDLRCSYELIRFHTSSI